MVVGYVFRMVVQASDSDSRPYPLTYAVSGSLPAGASFDPATRVLTWIHTEEQTGQHTIIFTSSDSLATASMTVTIQVDNQFVLFLPFARH